MPVRAENLMKRKLTGAMLVLGVALDHTAAVAQTISDRIYDPLREPGAPVIIGTLGEPIPLSIDEMTKRSDLVVETTLSRLKDVHQRGRHRCHHRFRSVAHTHI